MHPRRLLFPILLLLLLAAARASACVVPVFRYALERWTPDPFRITILHRNADAAELDAWLAPFEEGYVDGWALNLETDLDQVPEALAAAATSIASNAPMAFLQYPMDYGTDLVIATQAVTQAAQASWLRSPLREELAKRILAKDSTVWILVLGQNSASNQAARTMLENSLRELAGDLEIPEGMLAGLDEEAAAAQKAALPIRFSILELDPDDPAEAIFFEAMRALEPDLYTNRTHAVVVPAFGQGRALGQFPAQLLTPDVIADMCYFLTGSCSCEVKELNPGFDLFMPRYWFDELDRSFVDEHRMGAQLFNPMSYEPEEPTPESTPTAAPTPVPAIPEISEASGHGLYWMLGVALLLLAVGGLFLMKKGDA